MIEGGVAGTDRDEAWWRGVRALLDRVWPGLDGAIARAGRWGASWAAQSTPFAWIEDGRVLAHVGVLRHPLVLDGTAVEVAGVHAVCSDPDARGRGYVVKLLEAATAWIDEQGLVAKLHTDVPALYAKVGFFVVPTYRFVLDRAGGGGSARPFTEDPADVARLRACLDGRARLSDRFDHRGDGALPLTNAAIHKGDLSWFHHAEDLDAVLALERRGDDLVLLDVAAPRLPSLDDVLAAVPFPFERVVFLFPPDRLAPEARAEPLPEEAGTFQVRGAWPEALEFGVPWCWEH